MSSEPLSLGTMTARVGVNYVRELSATSENRLAALEGHLRQRSADRSSKKGPALPQASLTSTRRTREWAKNEERNQTIRNRQERGDGGRKICEALDELTIEVLESLRERSVFRWVEGWDNPRLRRSIQQLFWKEARLSKPVKR